MITVQEYNDTTLFFFSINLSFLGSKIHVNNAADATPALDIANRLTDGPQREKKKNDTHVHIVEAIVDRCKCSLVGNVLVNLDLALQVIWNNGP